MITVFNQEKKGGQRLPLFFVDNIGIYRASMDFAVIGLNSYNWFITPFK